jgi:hypothetical protein
MMVEGEMRAVIRYISERRCTEGGYCFYRLPEPNAADTHAALDAYNRLGGVQEDPATGRFLCSLQRPDGSYTNPFVARAAIRGLLLLGKVSEHDPAQWLLGRLRFAGDGEAPPETISRLEGLLATIECCRLLRIPINQEFSRRIVHHLRSSRHEDRGWGSVHSTLIETGHALRILSLLGDVESIPPSEQFLRLCEDSTFGFLSLPGATPAFIESVTAGIQVCHLLHIRPRYQDACRRFIRSCELQNGGYCRSQFGGAATLEYTGMALEAIALLDRMDTAAWLSDSYQGQSE